MIVRERPSGWRLFFILRGSIAPKVAPQVLAATLVAAIGGRFHGTFFERDLTFTAAPFTIFGLALSIFLGFRNNAAYDRYWEGRRLWGDLGIAGRTLARQAHSLLGPGQDAADDERLRALRRRMACRAIPFAHALRHRLRGTDPEADLRPLLDGDELRAVAAAADPPAAVLAGLNEELRECLARG